MMEALGDILSATSWETLSLEPEPSSSPTPKFLTKQLHPIIGVHWCFEPLGFGVMLYAAVGSETG